MGRKTRILRIFVSPEIADEYEEIAERERKSKSELFRQMVEAYKARLEDEEFSRLQKRMTRRARRKGIFTEKDVERIIFKDR